MFLLTTLVLFAVLAAALMVAGHYMGPRVAGRRLHRLEAYVVGGAGGIALPFAGWCLVAWLAGHAVADWRAPVGLVVIMGGAGLGTGLSWAADLWAGRRAETQARRGKP